MLLMKGHGVTPVISGDTREYPDGRAMSAAAACGFASGENYPADPVTGKFGYYFENAEGHPENDHVTAKLDALADAMVDNPSSPEGNSRIPPVFTYMGQFIDHDITANTDRETGLSVIDVEKVTPVARPQVSKQLGNLRFASLNLDSVYGGAPVQGEFARTLAKALRWPKDRAKMEAGTDFDTQFAHIPLPADPARDLFRMGWAIKSGQIKSADLAKVPPELKDKFFNKDDSPRVQRAIIGDMRNDENLAVAQFHLAMIRLHNEIVDAAGSNLPLHDRDEVYHWAQKMTRWTYQWLVMNAYLPAVCDPEVLSMVKDKGPKLYQAFFKANSPSHPDLMPMPLEFSVAAFRFGHTMARASYDWNRNFGRGDDPILDRSDFNLLFRFTGDAMAEPRLPEHWPIEWDRFVLPPSTDFPDRAARKIDTLIAPPLHDMVNVMPGLHNVLRVLPRRNLRRGYRLNIPTAQGCLSELEKSHGIKLKALTPAQIASGGTKQAIKDGGFDTATPLWFYILKEAELLCDGETLGPLGSLLVADTLIGLMVCHPESYLNAAPGGGKWEPQNSVKPNGVAITRSLTR